MGHLLAQQLLAAGERVLDVPPKLAARVRLQATFTHQAYGDQVKIQSQKL